MKLIKHLLLLSGLLALSVSANALPILSMPSSLANSSLFINVTNSTGLLPSTGFSVIMVDSTGMAYTKVSSGANSTGVDVYVPLGSTATLLLTDNLLGILNGLLTATGDAVSGTLAVTNLLSTQNGTFAIATNRCPVAVSGQTFTFNVTSGASPLATNGTFNITTSLSDKTFVYAGSTNTAGSYTYTNINASTALLTATDTNSNQLLVYLGYSNSASGSFAVKGAGGAYQMGTFYVTNNYPATFFDAEVPLGQGAYYLKFANSNLFGYYNLTFFPYVYHYEMGWEYFIDVNHGSGGCFLYDFTARHFLYTSSSLFPYLYDFSLNAWLYYYPNPIDPQSYSTNPRYFYNFGTTNTITE